MGTGALELKVASQLLHLAEKQGWIDKLINAFRTKHHVLVLGTSGTGKSQLISSLSDAMPATIDRLNRSSFREVAELKISNSPFVFTAVPGERTKTVARVEVIREAIKGITGIIDVTSYGYHEGTSAETDVFDANGHVRQQFLEKGRSEEIAALDEWTTVLGDRTVARWLVTVVTKADLWWEDRNVVMKHYESGEYFKALGRAQSLGPTVIDYCSVVHKFYGRGPVSGDFDDADRVRLRAHLLRQLFLAVER